MKTEGIYEWHKKGMISFFFTCLSGNFLDKVRLFQLKWLKTTECMYFKVYPIKNHKTQPKLISFVKSSNKKIRKTFTLL